MIERIQNKWYKYLHIALVYAMFFQTTFVFDFLWFDRTFTMLAYILTCSLAIQFFAAPLHKLLRLLMELALLFILAINFSKAADNYVAEEHFSLWHKLGFIIVESWQFIGVGLSFFIVAKLLVHVTHMRVKMAVFFTLAILLLLIVDSFSPIVLWVHVTAIIVLFLFWHMCWHYERIRQSNEAEFPVILESPLSIMTPFAIVVSVAVIVASIMPYGPPWLEDPYALWKKSRGEEVPAFLGDKGFTSTVVRNQNRSSGYTRSSSVLGGGFDFNYETVMEINTPQKSYWRGETINYYDGIGWVDTIHSYNGVNWVDSLQNSALEFVYIDERIESDRPLATTKELNISVSVLREEAFPVLFYPSYILSVNEVIYKFDSYVPKIIADTTNTNATDTVLAVVNSNRQDIYKSENIFPGFKRVLNDNTLVKVDEFFSMYPISYRLTGDVLQLDTEKLITASASMSDPVLHQLYTNLPETLPQEVVDLAQLVTASSDSDYEKAKLIEDYLKRNYAYANRPNEERLTGEEDDFVYKFLFELYEGYCDYFSTSMAVMAKSLGMPARWVKGFAPGVNMSEQYLDQIPMSYEDTERFRNQLSGGLYNVRNADAHSWVEIYFEGYGWIAFEPTPGFSYPYEYVSDEAASLELSLLEQDALEIESSVTSSDKSYNYVWSIFIILGLIVLLGLILIVFRHEPLIKKLAIWRYKKYDTNDRIVYEFNQFLKYCQRRGLKRLKSQTVYDAISTWRHGSRHWKEQLSELYKLFEQARYSAVQLEAVEAKRVSELIKTLKKQWKY